MTDFEAGHPCRGKDCKDCETCIFDADLFPNGVKPNTKEKLNNKNDMSALCNKCIHLQRSYENCVNGRFDASCKLVKFEAFGEDRPRRMQYSVSLNDDIVSPNWCPLKKEASNILNNTSSSSLPTTTPSSQTSTPAYTSISDRREKMKELPKHIEWKDIKEGGMYVIPRILSQSKKIVKVITKTDMSCICHEISEYTGNEYTYNTTVYPTDLDAVFITELRNF